MAMAEKQISANRPLRRTPREAPAGCADCSYRRPGWSRSPESSRSPECFRGPEWFCSLGSAVLADLDLASSAISLPAQASLFTEDKDARCLYLICSGYMKLTAGRKQDRRMQDRPMQDRPMQDRPMIVRVAGPGSLLGLYAALSHGIFEVSAESLTAVRLRVIERERFLNFLRSHEEAQMRAVECICQEYRFALQDACRIGLSETVATRLGRLLLELAQQIGERLPDGEWRFPLLLKHEELASMTSTARETVTRTLSQFRRDGWISIADSQVTLHQPARLQMLL